MDDKNNFLLLEEIYQPANRLPKILNKPIKAKDHPVKEVGSPQYAITPGICVDIKATWNPQVKNPNARKL